jgi:hypothetical protein
VAHCSFIIFFYHDFICISAALQCDILPHVHLLFAIKCKHRWSPLKPPITYYPFIPTLRISLNVQTVNLRQKKKSFWHYLCW